jgi:hypothetical protein
MSIRRLLAITAFVLTTAGCATTTASIEQVWRAPGHHASELTSVVTLFPSRDPDVRRRGEDKLARQLSTHGMYAVPSYRVLTEADLQDRDRGADALRRAGFDGVVAMRIVDAQQWFEYYPSYDVYWGAAWGSLVPRTIVRVQINAYALQGKILVWSALSRSVDPDSVGTLIDDVTQLASEQLHQQQVIVARR